MIYVTIGAIHLGFPRPIRKVDKIAGATAKDELILAAGSSIEKGQSMK